MSFPGPFAMLRRSPVMRRDNFKIFSETVHGCILSDEFHDIADRHHIAHLRTAWEETLQRTGHAHLWQHLVDRDLLIAECILDDAAHNQFLCGMRNRLRLRYAILELDLLVHEPPPPPTAPSAPSRSAHAHSFPSHTSISSSAPDPDIGPIWMLQHSPVLHKEDFIRKFAVTMQACLSTFYEVDDMYARWELACLRHVWEAQIAAGHYAAHWQDLVERDLRMASSILDDPSHHRYIRGMRKRILLEYLLLELSQLVYTCPYPAGMAPLPPTPLEWPSRKPAAGASTSAPALDAKQASR